MAKKSKSQAVASVEIAPGLRQAGLDRREVSGARDHGVPDRSQFGGAQAVIARGREAPRGVELEIDDPARLLLRARRGQESGSPPNRAPWVGVRSAAAAYRAR